MMNVKNMKHMIHNRKGISLLEVLLVIGLMTALATGAAALFDDWFKKSVNRKVATEMTDLHSAAEQFVILNMDYVIDDFVPNEDDVAEIDISELIDRDFLPADFTPRNSFNQEMRVIVRNAGDDTVKGTAIEVLILADDRDGRDSRMSDSRLFDAALSGGPKLGLISAANMGPNCCNGNIQSAYGEWSVPLSEFLTVYNRTPETDIGGYMASYARVSMQDINNGDYLYRVEMPNDPHLNRMQTNMDLNNNDIVNAGVVVSDNMRVTGDATLEGRAASGAVSPYVLAVQDSFAGNAMTVTANGDSKGDLIVNGDTNGSTHDFSITGNVTLPAATGAVVTSAATVNIVEGMSAGVFDTLNVRGSQFRAGNIVTVTSAIDGNVQTSFLQTAGAQVGTVTARRNAVVGVANVTGNTSLSNSLISGGGVAINGASNSNRLIANETMAIGRMIHCGSGCP